MDGERRTAALSRELEPDRGVDPGTGLLIERPGESTNFEPFWVRAGDTLALKDPSAAYRISFYRPGPDPRLLFTYCYQPEANWTVFAPEESDRAWKTEPTVFSGAGCVRVTVRGGHSLRLEEVMELASAPGAEDSDPLPPSWIAEEADRVAGRVKKVLRDSDAALALLTDTHYAIGCNWPDTAESLRQVRARLPLAGVIHLGDVTDGSLPETWTRRFAGRVLTDLRSLGLPADGCLGNHDANYFLGNAHPMDKAACSRLYLGRGVPWYTRDLAEVRVRMFFLDSFDPAREQRYGFSGEEISWLEKELRRVPEGWRVLVFSHVPPLARLHVWSSEILGSAEVLRVLTRFHRERSGAVLGWIHGHNHADQIYTGEAFPIVSVGCTKTEAFPEHKPRGSVTRERRWGEPSQELWDVLVLHAHSRDFDLIRFGAGADRHTLPVG